MGKYQKKTYIKVCPVCGKTFVAHYKTRMYCSTYCCDYVRNEKKKKRRGIGRPKKRIGKVYKRIKKETLCWTCQNAVCGCSWSRNFEPVKGWEAEPTKIKLAPGCQDTDSYKVTYCPEYIKDEKR